MSKQYKHLSKEERDRLAVLKGQGCSIREIATHLNRSPSTISRELRRNADWTSLQLIQAYPFDTSPRYLIRDRDSIYDQQVVDTLYMLGIRQVVIPRRSPWQNGFCERIIGTIRRDCLDHLIVMNERHLRRVLKEYLAYYHRSRTLCLQKIPSVLLSRHLKNWEHGRLCVRNHGFSL